MSDAILAALARIEERVGALHERAVRVEDRLSRLEERVGRLEDRTSRMEASLGRLELAVAEIGAKLLAPAENKSLGLKRAAARR